MEKNFDLRIKQEDVYIAQDDVEHAKGEFDPSAYASGTYENNIRKLNAIDYESYGISSANPEDTLFHEDNIRTQVGITGKLPTGTEYDLTTTLNRLDNDVNKAGRFFSPEYESFAGITLTQSLLKGFGTKAGMADLRAARVAVHISQRTREVEVINKLIELTDAYYDMVFGLENLKVKQQAVSLAQKLRDENSERVRLGKMTSTDVTEADIKISEAKEEQILGEDFVRERRMKMLKLMLNKFSAGPIPEFTVATELSIEPITQTAAQYFETAIAQRPDYLLAQDEIRKGHITVDQTRNGLLPQLDLKLSYGKGGLDDTFGSSYEEIADQNQRRLSGGIVASFPIGNHKALADYHTAQHKVTQAQLSLDELKTSISLEVSNAVEHLAALQRRLDTASQSRQYAEQGLDVEQNRLEQGQTTSFSVLDFQRKVSDARTREIAARVDLKKAESELWGSVGIFMTKNGFVTDTEPNVHS
jgi:outer membrane protein TolC